MLIVCTRDRIIVNAARDPSKHADRWGDLVILNDRSSPAQATVAMSRALQGYNGPLCFSAHGNDTDIGDEGNGVNDWGWSCNQIAALMQNALPANFRGPVLIHACADTVANFAAGLAVALENLRIFNGLWIYGYSRALPADAGYPEVATMGRNAELQGAQVRFRLASGDAGDATVPHGSDAMYRATLPGGCVVELGAGFDPDEAREFIALLTERAAR